MVAFAIGNRGLYGHGMVAASHPFVVSFDSLGPVLWTVFETPHASTESRRSVDRRYASTVTATRWSSLRPDLGKGRGRGCARPLASIVRQHSS